MKKKRIALFIAIICFIQLFHTTSRASSRIYQSATEYDYPPFSVTDGGVPDGFSVELLQEVAKVMGLNINFKIDHWEVIKGELERGELDVLPLVGKTEERAQYFDFTTPYIVMHGNIFVRKDTKDIQSEADLFGKEIIVMSGDNAYEYAERVEFSNKIITTKTYREAFELLSSGKHDAVLAQSVVGMKLIKDLNIRNVEAVTQLDMEGLDRTKLSVNLDGFEQQFCFAVQTGDKELLAILNEGLVLVSESGKYQELYDKWFPFLIDREVALRTILTYVLSVTIPVSLLILLVSMLMSKREVKRKTTDLKQSNEDLQLQKQAAEVANLAKSQFLANMSHEIRTPMNGLLGMLQLLERTELEPKQQQYVRLAMTSSDSLMKVINDILDYSKLESGMMQLDNHTFELKKMVRDVIALFQPSVDEKGLVLSYNFDPDLPDLLKGDSFRLRQVMTNLIGNAIKFTQKGSVIIRINRIATLTKTEEAGQIRLEFLVEDTGIGISSDKLDMLFKSFSQLDTSNTRRFGGTGLGLVISKSLVERMQGEMIVRSVFGQGSLFGFTFLLEIDTDTNEKAIRTPGSFSTNKSLKSPLAGSDAFKKNAENHENVIMPSLEEGDKTDIPDKGKIIHILLAEDDLMSQKIMVQIANNNGWEITVAKDGKQAVERFGEQRFDLVLMDVQMPVLDGLAAARTLRTMESGTDRRTPIIALTAFALDGDREKCIAAGMDDYLSKPLHIERFQTLVQEWIYG